MKPLQGKLQEAGGHEQLLDLLEAVVTGAAVAGHAAIVREHSRRRELLHLARDLELRLYEGEAVDDVIGAVELGLRAVAPANAAPTGLLPADVLARWSSEGPLVHVPTGFPQLDSATGGGPPFGARCYVLGAPDAGKTLFVVAIADHVLAKGMDVGFLAIDEEPGDVLTRFLQRRGFSRQDCERRSQRDLAAMRAAMADVGLFLYGDEFTIEAAAQDLAARAQKRGRPAALIIDSIQTARSESEPADASMHVVVTLRTRAIRALATAHKLVAYVTSEMGRAAYRSVDAGDRIADLAAAKESGAIEYTARFMVALRNVPGETDLIEASITKNKFGPIKRPGEPGIHLRIDRAAQTLTEDAAFITATKGDREEQRAQEQDRQAVEDAAVLAVVIVDEPGIAKTDAEEEFRRRARCGTRRWKKAWGVLRKAVSEHRAPRNRLSLYLDGAKAPAEVVAHVPVADRARVLSSVADLELHRAAPRSTADAGAPSSELHHHPLCNRGGAARGCSCQKEGAAASQAGAAQQGGEP